MKELYINIQSETDEERGNVTRSIEAMQEVMRAPTVVEGALMPDACPAGSLGHIPVGGVVATRNAIHPEYHSADVCCSVMATNFGKTDPKTILDRAHAITHFGAGGREPIVDVPEYVKSLMKQNQFLDSQKAKDYARTHLATQGDGNHFCFVGVSRLTGDTHMVTHHGSRGLGAWLFTKGKEVAEQFRQKLSPETNKISAWIPYDTWEGESYWDALQIVREWTWWNHKTLHDAIGLPFEDQYWNEHNFVFKRDDVFYHAKGATPLSGRCIIPLNMAQPVLIIAGRHESNNLGFTVHGAGRNVSRGAHRRKQTDTVEDIMRRETEGIDVRFFSGTPDISELPSAYKNADSVRAQIAQFNLGTVIDEIVPYGCIMAGTFDWSRKSKKEAQQ